MVVLIGGSIVCLLHSLSWDLSGGVAVWSTVLTRLVWDLLHQAGGRGAHHLRGGHSHRAVVHTHPTILARRSTRTGTELFLTGVGVLGGGLPVVVVPVVVPDVLLTRGVLVERLWLAGPWIVRLVLGRVTGL